MGRRLEFTVPKEYDGKKVIHLLRGFAGVSARTVGTLKRTPDGITLNGAHIRTIDRIKEGDVWRSACRRTAICRSRSTLR